ncbi:MAG: cation transporter [Acholeplasmatales bacterium]|nr:cation transporter [Acholeplasmatales bacterium]
MVNFLRKKFIKNYENLDDEIVRVNHGILSAIVGIISNLLISLMKLVIGIVTFSVAIIGDAINNLSDMISSIVSLVGFHMSKKPADQEHPFGHERIEYIAGLIVSMIISFTAGILIYESILKIINYKVEVFDIKVSIITISILSVSIIIKLLQSRFYNKMGKIINSKTLIDNSFDSLFDVLSTTVILVGFVVMFILSLNNISLPFSLDGVLGIAVGLFILFSSFMLIKDEVSILIGEKNDHEIREKILAEIAKSSDIIASHDLLCHMYGPTKCFATIHVEVSNKLSLDYIHNIIDEIEDNVEKKYGINLTIHVDPKNLDDVEELTLQNIIEGFLFNIHKDITIHDFRTKGKVISFDLVEPFDLKLDKEEFEHNLKEYLGSTSDYELEIKYEHAYI